MSSINKKKLYCGFCLKDHETLKKENQILHAGLDAFICEGCVETLIYIKSKKFQASKVGKKISRLRIDDKNFL